MSVVKLRIKLTWSSLDSEDYIKVQLPPRESRVTIFVDSETESKPTTNNTAEDGHSNVFLARIYLDRLSRVEQILRFLGQLRTLYITKEAKSWSGKQSLRS